MTTLDHKIAELNREFAYHKGIRTTVPILMCAIDHAMALPPDVTSSYMSFESWFKERKVTTISLPRSSYKTSAYEFLREQSIPGTAFMDANYLAQNFRGTKKPFGPNTRVLVFDECKNLDHVIEFLKLMWFVLGYTTYPHIINIKT